MSLSGWLVSEGGLRRVAVCQVRAESLRASTAAPRVAPRSISFQARFPPGRPFGDLTGSDFFFFATLDLPVPDRRDSSVAQSRGECLRTSARDEPVRRRIGWVGHFDPHPGLDVRARAQPCPGVGIRPELLTEAAGIERLDRA